jgi:hypothetical protein
MALDSLEKRRNVPGVGRPWMRMIHPVATPDEQWRMAVGLTYGGNVLTPAAGRIMSSLAAHGGLVGHGGIAGPGGGLAG